MRGSFRDTSKIIFRKGGVKTIDKFIARSFDIFHCVPSVLFRSPTRAAPPIRALRVALYCDVAAALRQEQFQLSALSKLTAQGHDRACFLDLEAVICSRRSRMKVIARTRPALLHNSGLTIGMHRLRGRVFRNG